MNLKVASFLQNQKPSYGYLFCEQPVQFPFGHAGVQADDSTMFQTWQHEHKGNYEVCEEKVVHFLSDPGHLQRGKTKWSKKHVGHLFPEGAETLPAAHSQMLGLHQVTTDLTVHRCTVVQLLYPKTSRVKKGIKYSARQSNMNVHDSAVSNEKSR